MKYLAIIVLALCCSGCAVVRVSTPAWSVTAASLFKTVSIPSVKIDGSKVNLIGYNGTVAGEELGNAVGAAVTAIK